MTSLKKLPIGIRSFPKLIEGDHVYVDKTEDIHRLITGGVAYFLSRPRRFGKSLLVSTLKAIFKGRRALFEGLWIGESDYDWPIHPVIHLDLSRASFETPAQFQPELIRQLTASANQYGLEPGSFQRAAPMLDDLITRLREKAGSVVVLVDEYDKPILDCMADVPKALAIRDLLRGVYTILKAQDENLRFVFLTGVSRFSKVSVFSGINQLEDITQDLRLCHHAGLYLYPGRVRIRFSRPSSRRRPGIRITAARTPRPNPGLVQRLSFPPPRRACLQPFFLSALSAKKRIQTLVVRDRDPHLSYRSHPKRRPAGGGAGIRYLDLRAQIGRRRRGGHCANPGEGLREALPSQREAGLSGGHQLRFGKTQCGRVEDGNAGNHCLDEN